MGQVLNEFRSVLQLCSESTLELTIPFMYGALTGSNSDASDADVTTASTPRINSEEASDPQVTLDAVVSLITRFVGHGMHEGFLVMSLLGVVEDALMALSDTPAREKQRALIQRTLARFAPSTTPAGRSEEDDETIKMLTDSANRFDEIEGPARSAYDDWQVNVSPYLSKLRRPGGWMVQGWMSQWHQVHHPTGGDRS